MSAFEFGDLVHYRTELTTGAWVSVYGRIMGRLTENSSFMFGASNVYKYLIRTFIDIPPNFDDVVDWGLRGDHVDVMRQAAEKTLILDWGEAPPRDPKHVWVALEASELATIVGTSDRKFFKRGGNCPSCGQRGEWIRLGLFCAFHGQFAG